MKPNFLVWAAVAAFFIFKSKNAQASMMPTNYGGSAIDTATGAEVLPGMLEEGGTPIIDQTQDIEMTPHFSLAEFTASNTAARKGINNQLPDALQGNAMDTLAMLESIRSYLSATAGHDVPVIISSGYRSDDLNAAIGGAKNSDHLQAMAVDWTAPSFGTPVEIVKVLAPVVDDLGIGQLINEFPGVGGWVHTSTKRPILAQNRIITITAKGTISGIVEA